MLPVRRLPFLLLAFYLLPNSTLWFHAQDLNLGASAPKCSACDGRQRVVCPECDGGEDVCAHCDENSTQPCNAVDCDAGATRCPTCDGKGTVIREGRPGEKTRKSVGTCATCNGKKSVACAHCERGRMACARCDGRPKTRCTHCQNQRSVVCARCDRFVGVALQTIERCDEQVAQLLQAQSVGKEVRDQVGERWADTKAAVAVGTDSNLQAQLAALDEPWAQYGDAFVRLEALFPLVDGSRSKAARILSGLAALANRLQRPAPTQAQQLELSEVAAVAARYQRHVDSFRQLLQAAETYRSEFEAKLQSIEGARSVRNAEREQKAELARELGLAFTSIRADILELAAAAGLPNPTSELVAARSTKSALIVELAYFDRDAERAPTPADATPTDAYLKKLPALFDVAFQKHPVLGRLRVVVDGLRGGRGSSGRMRIQSFFVGRTAWQRLRGETSTEDWSTLLAALRPKPEFPRPGPGWAPIVFIVFLGFILLVSIITICLTTDILKSFG